MQFRYDEDLVEAAAFVCTSGKRRGIAPLQIRRFHHEREKLYSVLDPEERNSAFFRLHLEWFREWELEKLLMGVLNSFGLFDEQLEVMAFRKARTKSDEGAELYVNDHQQRHGVVALRPERFERDENLVPFLNHELQHLSDMVDPSFGYSRDIFQPGWTVSQQRLIAERYRLLWDVAIDGRLTANGHETTDEQQRWTEFNRAFSFLTDEKRASTFRALWTNPDPTHGGLMELASNPRGLTASPEQTSGAPCPLCGFTTFHWGKLQMVSADILRRIETEFPLWTPDQGACSRCCEVYKSASVKL